MHKLTIRKATVEDANTLLAIYAPYVEHTAITFEYEVPSLEDFQQRIINISKRYPWLVIAEGENILGYAYASAFKERAAFQWAVETSIYMNEEARGQGLGARLHEALEKELQQQGILNMNACIAYAEQEDEFLTHDSVRFHERMDYRQVAHFHQCGRKFDRWYDIVWMEKFIGEHR